MTVGETSEMRGIAAIGAYLPALRFERAAAAKSLRFAGIGGRHKGRRAVAGWDEDALTLAVESARHICGTAVPDTVIFASTSAPFIDRSHAGLVVDALALPETVRTNDVSGSRRCAVSALLNALLGRGTAVIAAGENRPAKAGSSFQMIWGDGSASVRVEDDGGARLIGHASLSHDLIDFYASREHPTPYAYEERFVRDTAANVVLAPTIKRALDAAGIAPADIAHVAVAEPLPGLWPAIARLTGITVPNHASHLQSAAGDLGAAHPLYALALAIDAAAPGERILLAGFGNGCDALIFELAGEVEGAGEATAMLSHGLAGDDYLRFLSLTGTVDLDWGVRSEFEQKAQATVLERHGRDAIGFVGGRDRAGNVQFPKSRIPVRPDAEGPEDLVDVRLADLPAKLVSVTADRLNYTPDPPFWFGLVQFENGARVMMELTDADQDGFAVDNSLRMRFRIKALDKRRGFRTYFWKAAPAALPTIEEAV